MKISNLEVITFRIWRPGIFGYRLDEIVQAFVLADGDGVADIHLAADGYHAMSVEPAVGP